MSDGWSDGKNRTIINFLVSCPQGTMFLKSVDPSDKVKDAILLFELLDNVIQEVGEQHVVQVITDNASNYVLAGKMVEAKYFKGPSMHDLRGALLQKEISSIDEYLVEFKDSWLKKGCSIMSDGWTDGKNRTIISFLVRIALSLVPLFLALKEPCFLDQLMHLIR